MQGEPGCDQSCDNDKKAKISEADVKFFEVSDLRFAGLLAIFVFLGRGGVGGRHSGIIAYAFREQVCGKKGADSLSAARSTH